MKEKLLNNLGLKIVALILAFIIWMAIVNISNPVVQGQPYTISVDIRNGEILTENGLTYELDGKESVTVNYNVRTRDSSLIRASDFSAYIDLKDYSVTGAVPVTVEVNKEKESLIVDGEVTTKPMVLQVKTEALQKKTFDLKVDTKDKLPEDGYALGMITLSPTAVVAEGPESSIGQIASIGIEIDEVENATADLEGEKTPILYDANGKELILGDKVVVKPETIHYNVAVLKAKPLTLNFEVRGTVANGYRFTGVECDVKSVQVVGTKSVLASVNTLSVADDRLSIEGATSDKTVHLDLSDYLPPSTTIAGDAESQATVTMKVEPLTTRVYTLLLADLASQGSNPDYEYSYSRDSVDVTVRGLKEDLESLDTKDLNAVLDVTAMQPGEQPGEIIFEVSDGFEVVGYSDFEVTVTSETENESSEEAQPANASSPNEGETETETETETSAKATE